MGVFKRFKTGLALAKDSIFVIVHNPKLIVFPLLSGICGLAFLGLCFRSSFGLATLDPQGFEYVILGSVYFVLTFTSSFFTVALVHQTGKVFYGKEPSLRDGIAAAWDRKWPVVIWSIVAVVVGIIVSKLNDSGDGGGKILGSVLSFGWAAMTFFIIPVIAFDRPSTLEMFKQSGHTFKQTFGETAISLFAISIISWLIFLPFGVTALLFALDGVVVAGIGTALTGVLIAFLVNQTLQGVVKTALYTYAKTGEKPSEFDNVDFMRLNEDGASQGSNTTTRHNDPHRP